MIKLQRPTKPRALSRRAKAETDELWKALRRSKGKAVPKAKSGLYAHAEVKAALRDTAQHGKCAFCETINPSSYDVIEHYRPKDGWKQKRGDALQKPQYFWLAYEWENLLFACDLCNDQGHKGNLFPLRDETKRATVAAPETSGEDPLLINPYGPLDPEEHIEWNRDVPRAHNGSIYGETTIQVLGLDRDDWRADQRRARFADVERMLECLEPLPVEDPVREELGSFLRSQLSDAAEWAAMIRGNLRMRIEAL